MSNTEIRNLVKQLEVARQNGDTAEARSLRAEIMMLQESSELVRPAKKYQSTVDQKRAKELNQEVSKVNVNRMRRP